MFFLLSWNLSILMKTRGHFTVCDYIIFILYFKNTPAQSKNQPITRENPQTFLECFNHRSTHNVHLYVIIMLQIIIIPLLKASCIFWNLSDWIISYQYEYFAYPSCTVADFNAPCTSKFQISNEYSGSSFFVLGL